MKIIFISAIFITQTSLAQIPDVFIKSFKITDSVKCTSVKDQYLSSTCWSFASNSFIESEVLKKKGIKTDLSEMYVARYSYINKIQQYLSQKGKIFFTPGGQFHDVLKVIKQYGIVPENVYDGKVKGALQHNHAELDTIIKYFTEDLLNKNITSLNDVQLIQVNKILDKYLGKVPATFLYNGKKYTPLIFTKDLLGFKPEDYIEITSYTHHPFYQKFILEDKYNWSKDEYYNIPLSDFEAITQAALTANYSVCWDGDVTEEGFNFEKGSAALFSPFDNFIETRQSTYFDKTSTIDHMMHIVAIAKDKNNRTWYNIKNSWGIQNPFGGYLFMSNDYFKIKTIAIIVNKNAIPKEIRTKMKI